MSKAIKFMGSACKHGHEGLRYVRGGMCVHCALLAALKQRQARAVKVPEPAEVTP